MNTLHYFAVRPPRSVHWRVPDGSAASTELGEGRASRIDPAQPHDFAHDHDRNLIAHARHCLNEHTHFRGRMKTISIDGDGDRLVVTGQLPSFYLKQLLQSALMQVDGVGDVENHVDVINCDGLSSEKDE